MYKRLIKDINFRKIGELEPGQRLEKLTALIRNIVEKDKIIITEKEIGLLAEEIYLDSFEFGPISPLIKDPGITEIMVNSYQDIYVEREGKLEKTQICFRDNGHLKNIIDKILSPLGLRVDESSPMVDARLKDGSRINVVLAPISVSPMVATIRKFKKDIMGIRDLIGLGMLDQDTADFLRKCVIEKVNMITYPISYLHRRGW